MCIYFYIKTYLLPIPAIHENIVMVTCNYRHCMQTELFTFHRLKYVTLLLFSVNSYFPFKRPRFFKAL